MKIKDSVWLGIIFGLIAPSIGIVIFYLINFKEESLLEFVSVTIEGKILSPLLSLCAVINLGIFYLFLHFDKLYIARGVILATMIYGIVIVVSKFVM